MVHKKSWQELQESGLLWWINTILHTFGWAIVIEVGGNKEIISAYPARVKFRGFSDDIVDDGYRKVSQYMLANAAELKKEACEEE